MKSKIKRTRGYNDRYLPMGLEKIESLLNKHNVPDDLTSHQMCKRARNIAEEINKGLPKNAKQFRFGQILEHISFEEYGFYKWTALKSLLMCREKLRKEQWNNNRTFEFSEKIKYGA